LVLNNLNERPWPRGKIFGFIQGYIIVISKYIKLNCDVIKVFMEKVI
jgi:hypothetical protein